jgi:hypothetical protein
MLEKIYKYLLKDQYDKFIKSSNEVESQQNAKLLQIIEKNKNSLIGKYLKFKDCTDISGFQKIVPLSQYEDYPKWFKEIQNCDDKILTENKILQFHLTSGTSSSSKYIPFTKELRTEFFAGLAPWLYNLSITFPSINKGSQYWIVSPSSDFRRNQKKQIGNISVGFDEDLSYFPTSVRILEYCRACLQNRQVPKSNVNEYFYNQALFILAKSDLTLISIWNPSFLILILEEIVRSKVQLINDLRQFSKVSLTKSNKLHLESVLSNLRNVSSDIKKTDWQLFWPQLQVISCWGSGWAKNTFHLLKNLFPNVFIQPKGLLATEGIITFPLQFSQIQTKFDIMQTPLQVLSINSHFFEFIDPDSQQIYLAHELKSGRNYEIVITTSGGLYRYKLGDLVKCTGHFNQCPVIEFISKIDLVSDLCGEKLHAEHVEREFINVNKSELVKDLEFKLFPVLCEDILTKKPYYLLEVYSNSDFDQLKLELNKFSIDLDKRLRNNYNYHNSRQIGQLGAIEFRIKRRDLLFIDDIRSTKKNYILQTKPINYNI